MSKSSEHCCGGGGGGRGGGLPGGENLRTSDFDDSKIFQSQKQHFVNTEHQLKSKLA